MAIVDTFNQVGIAAFGIAMPTLSPRWTDGTSLPTVNEAAMSLSPSAGASWRAPIAGIVTRLEAGKLDATLTRADGSIIAASGSGLLLTVAEQAFQRLKRLYTNELEQAGPTPERPGFARGKPQRPVPRYFHYATVGANATEGRILPDQPLEATGAMLVFDEVGLPIDSLAVASVFKVLMSRHEALQERPFGDPFDGDSEVAQIAASAGTATVRIRLCDFAGQPYDGSNLGGLSAVDAARRLFTLDAASGGGSDLSGTITKISNASAEQRQLKVGHAATGRLCDGPLAFADLPAGITLDRDFFTVYAVGLARLLTGEPDRDFDGSKLEDRPPVRLHEPATLLTDGNDVLGAADQALSTAAGETIAVGQAIEERFVVPATPGAAAHWPSFPAAVGGAAPAGEIPTDLRDNFAPVARFFDLGDPDAANVDVVLTLAGLPANAAVRVFSRKFSEDAREARGDGAGGVASAAGDLTLLLEDPLRLRRPGLPASGVVVPTSPTLHVDVMVVKRTGEARLFGNVTAPIGPADPVGTPTPAANRFGTAGERGVSRAGVLGLGGATGTLPPDPVDAAIALAGEGTPRDAPRLPTMARRELLVTGLTDAGTQAWTSVLGGGRLAGELISADPRRGAPGGPGGRETQAVGVSTANGRIAYDIARMALRRSAHLAERVIKLADDDWNEPAEPSELPALQPASATQGTFAGAVLQTIAPFCDLIDPDAPTIPTTFDDLVDWVADDLVPAGVPLRIQIINALNGLKDGDPLSESKQERLLNEVKRDVVASRFGRRDAQWALLGAIRRARHFVYIESPGFAPTVSEDATAASRAHAADLIGALDSRLAAAPGLRVIVCTPKHPDFAPGYEPFAAREVAARRSSILGLHSAMDANRFRSRVVSFHPFGFPGRPMRLETSTVVVDDQWLLIGSSSFRRRGLTFDGGTDLALVDTDIEDGRSPAIRRFRRALMAARLGVQATTGGRAPVPDPSFVRLDEGVEAFHVVRELLIAGGLGRIERLWGGHTPGLPDPDPDAVDMDVANPEGLEFDIVSALAIAAIAGASGF